MAIEKYILQDGSTLEITTTDKSIPYKESVVTTIDKVVNYKEVTTKIIPAASFYIGLPKSDTLVLSGQSNRVIENIRISNAVGVAAQLTNCSNITFKNCFFDGSAAEAITLYGCKNIIIEKCLFARATCGVYASTSQTVVVRNNYFVNMRRRSDLSRGQFVQFNTVIGAGNVVEKNKGENFFGESDPEDQISMFKSSGTSTSPIYIIDNMFRGGGPSLSGGGIVGGDHGGDNISIENNQLVDPGNYGAAIAGGNNNVLNNNRVFSVFHTWNNAGVIIWAQGDNSGVPVTCSNATYTNNHINWPYKYGGQNNYFNGKNCGTVKDSGNIYNESFAVMMPDFPKNLIDCVSEKELLSIRTGKY